MLEGGIWEGMGHYWHIAPRTMAKNVATTDTDNPISKRNKSLERSNPTVAVAV
jgi:hypothetical protein